MVVHRIVEATMPLFIDETWVKMQWNVAYFSMVFLNETHDI